MQTLVGTSGYSYAPWKGSFYPEKFPAARMLGYYAERFPTVEINNTFYRMPKESVLREWGARVPDGFTFSIKASQRITHHARLKNNGLAVRLQPVISVKLGQVDAVPDFHLVAAEDARLSVAEAAQGNHAD